MADDLSIPVSKDKWLRLEGAWPLTTPEWAQMLAVLEAMKPVLVDDTGRLNK